MHCGSVPSDHPAHEVVPADAQNKGSGSFWRGCYLKLLYLVGRFPAASETFVAEEIRGMQARGHEVTVVALNRPRPAALDCVGPGLRDLVPTTHYVPRFCVTSAIRHGVSVGVWKLNARLSREATSPVRPLPRFARAMAVAGIIHKIGAEWIHAHWPRPTEIAMLASEMTQLPFSVSIHAHEVAHDSGHFLAAFERLSFATFCNAAAMELLLGQLPAEARKRSFLTYHGVDLVKFSMSNMPPIQSALRIVSAGRLTKTKGFDRLIRAVAQARTYGLEASLTIFGEGSERQRLEALILELELDGAVNLPGWIRHEDIEEAISTHHLFALMADDNFHDGLPNVVLEAMAVGRPVIISPLPAAKEVVRSGWNGVILSPSNGVDEAARALLWFFEEPERLSLFGKRAAISVRADHDRSMLLDQLDALFRRHRRG